MMTEKLYEQNSLLKNCSAIVTDCVDKDGHYLVELDRTVLFPEGGGQLCDQGKIGGVAVTQVREKEGRIWHECLAPLQIGQQVQVELNWPLRLDRMQQHCGEHILSFACWKLFQTQNVGFHMNEDSVFIDVDKFLTDEELEQAEALTNEIIWENRPVSVQYLPHEEAAQLKAKMRKFNDKLTGLLRIVTVEGADVCTCCGTHPPFTGMIGMVKVIGKVKHKEGCRIEFVCGRRALRYTGTKLKVLREVAESLSTAPELIMESLHKQKSEKDALQAKLGNANKILLKSKLEQALSQATAARGFSLCGFCYEGLDGREEKYLQDLIKEQGDVLLLFLNNYGGRYRYSLMRGNTCQADCGKLLRELNSVFAGKGGGKGDFAQGSREGKGDMQVLLQQGMGKICEGIFER